MESLLRKFHRHFLDVANMDAKVFRIYVKYGEELRHHVCQLSDEAQFPDGANITSKLIKYPITI